MNRIAVVLVLLLSSLSPGIATAQEEVPPQIDAVPADVGVPSPGPALSLPVPPQPAVTTKAADAHWSVAAGVGMPSFADNIRDLALLLDVPVSVIAAARRPELQLLVERRTGPNTFVLFQLAGDYARDSDETTTDKAYVVTGSVGFRALYNPGAVVEVSSYGVVAFSAASLSEEYDDGYGYGVSDSTEGSSWTGGVGAGLALDRKLLDGLYLRFSTLVLKATYTSSSGQFSTADGYSETFPDSTRVVVGLDLKPSIHLRMEF
ncbi:MAG: hypothetical protein AAB426_06605 [Myxococcota bacterium]